MNRQTSTEDNAKQRIHELKVLQDELKSQKKSRSVYQAQPNSNIMFKMDKNDVFSASKRELDSLIQEYGDLTNDESEANKE